MNFQELQMQKHTQMTQTPIPTLIRRLSTPTLVTMMITSVYNLCDTYFVGNLGTEQSAAIGVVFSVMALIQAIGFCMGMGAGNYSSRLLGQKDHETAQTVASIGFVTSLFAGAVLTVFGLIYIDELVFIIGASESVAPYAVLYGQIILIGAPYMAASFVLNNLLRSQGNPFLGMVGIGVGAVLNIALDPLLIFTFRMGIAGAAVATIASQAVSFIVLLFLVNGKNGLTKVSFRRFKFDLRLYKEIFRTGLPSFYRQGLACCATILMNIVARGFSDAATAAVGIVARVFHFMFSIMLGIGQGSQPISGFNYGAKRYDRVLEAFWFCVKWTTIILTIVGTIAFVFAPQIISIFRDDNEVIKIGTVSLRLHCVALPVIGWTVMCNMLFQSIGKGLFCSILSLAQQGFCFIPLIFILPKYLGIFGLQASNPMAIILTFIISVPLGIIVLKELRRGDEK
ncbi:MAG: MATE family efflux transporter [Ruminococcaceae bacterium]|nr:MATE family efflux transporter [Oscillospiraceae bacterium]